MIGDGDAISDEIVDTGAEVSFGIGVSCGDVDSGYFELEPANCVAHAGREWTTGDEVVDLERQVGRKVPGQGRGRRRSVGRDDTFEHEKYGDAACGRAADHIVGELKA